MDTPLEIISHLLFLDGALLFCAKFLQEFEGLKRIWTFIDRLQEWKII